MRFDSIDSGMSWFLADFVVVDVTATAQNTSQCFSTFLNLGCGNHPQNASKCVDDRHFHPDCWEFPALGQKDVSSRDGSIAPDLDSSRHGFTSWLKLGPSYDRLHLETVTIRVSVCVYKCILIYIILSIHTIYIQIIYIDMYIYIIIKYIHYLIYADIF